MLVQETAQLAKAFKRTTTQTKTNTTIVTVENQNKRAGGREQKFSTNNSVVPNDSSIRASLGTEALLKVPIIKQSHRDELERL